MKKPKLKRIYKKSLIKEDLKDSVELKHLYSQEMKAVSFEKYLKNQTKSTT